MSSRSTRARHRKKMLEQMINSVRSQAFEQWVQLTLKDNPNGSSLAVIRHFEEAWIKSIQPRLKAKRKEVRK